MYKLIMDFVHGQWNCGVFDLYTAVAVTYFVIM